MSPLILWLATPVLGAAPTAGWAPQALPVVRGEAITPSRVVSLRVRDETPWILLDDASVWTLETDRTWTRRIEGLPASPTQPTQLWVTEGETLWASRGGPPTIWRAEQERWGPPEPQPSFAGWFTPLGDEHAIAIAGYDGRVRVRGPEGQWREGGESVGQLFALGSGPDAVWAASTLGAFRIAADGSAELQSDPEGARFITERVPGAVWWTDGSAVYEGLGDGAVHYPVKGTPLDHHGGAWVNTTDGLRHLADGEMIALTPPSRVLQVASSSSGVAWVLVEDGLLRSTDTSGLTHEVVTSRWILPKVDMQGLLATDVDEDGLDDLVGVVGGALRVWVQANGSFEERTSALSLDGSGVLDVAACRLDGGRRDWLIVSRYDASKKLVVHLLRPESDGFRDVAELAGVTAGAWREGALRPRFRCEDLDRDGDLDLIGFAGGYRYRVRRGVRLWQNLGQGWFRERALPARGHDQAGFPWDADYADLDRDGHLDMVLVRLWSPGLQLLRGGGDGSVEDRSAGSGLADGYVETPLTVMLEDLDRDRRPDLLYLDTARGPRVWRGLGGFRFEEVTEAWGLGTRAERPSLAGGLWDLDGDEWLDVVTCDGGGCTALLGGADGFGPGLILHRSPTRQAVRLRTPGGVALFTTGSKGSELIRLPAATAAPTAPTTALASAARDLAWTPRWVFGAGGALLILVFGGVGVGGAWVQRRRRRAPPELHRVQPGSLVCGDAFVVRGRLGRGGAADVFLVEDRSLRVERALKLLHDHVQDDVTLRERLSLEARTLARIEHPHIVRVYALVEHHGRPGIVMELMRGGSLEDRLDRDGPLTNADVVRIGIVIADVLAAVHAHGVLHRDIKPANILLDAHGTAKLADFGIAQVEESGMTRTGTFLGTFAYLAPEVRDEGRPASERADVFALGATLFHLATGQVPTLLLRESRRAALLDALPPSLAAVLDRATRIEPEARTPTAAALRQALEEL